MIKHLEICDFSAFSSPLFLISYPNEVQSPARPCLSLILSLLKMPLMYSVPLHCNITTHNSSSISNAPSPPLHTYSISTFLPGKFLIFYVLEWAVLSQKSFCDHLPRNSVLAVLTWLSFLSLYFLLCCKYYEDIASVWVLSPQNPVYIAIIFLMNEWILQRPCICNVFMTNYSSTT